MPADSQALMFALALAGLMVAVTAFDIKFGIIPDFINVAIFVVGLFMAAATPGSTILEGAIASALGFSLLWLVRVIHRTVRGYDGVGLGDVKFVGAASIWVGWESIAAALAISCLSALITIAVSSRNGVDSRGRRRIPFGPHLAAGFLIVVLIQTYAGEPITDLAFPFQRLAPL